MSPRVDSRVPRGASSRSMSEVIITLDNPDEELAIFGSRDQLLRQVRDGLRVKVLARRGEIRVDGDPERVEQARSVFESMRRLYRRQRTLSTTDVADLIDSAIGRDPDDTVRGLGRDPRSGRSDRAGQDRRAGRLSLGPEGA